MTDPRLEILLDRPCLKCGEAKVASKSCPHAVVTNKHVVVSVNEWRAINARLAELAELRAMREGITDPGLIEELAPHAQPWIKKIEIEDDYPSMMMLNNDEIVQNVLSALLRKVNLRLRRT